MIRAFGDDPVIGVGYGLSAAAFALIVVGAFVVAVASLRRAKIRDDARVELRHGRVLAPVRAAAAGSTVPDWMPPPIAAHHSRPVKHRSADLDRNVPRHAWDNSLGRHAAVEPAVGRAPVRQWSDLDSKPPGSVDDTHDLIEDIREVDRQLRAWLAEPDRTRSIPVIRDGVRP